MSKGARRRSIHVKGLEHRAPIPSGAVVGSVAFSSPISGRDPASGELPSDPERQAQMLFENVRRFMEAAGGTVDDIGCVKLYVQKIEYRDVLNKSWVAMFPDEHNRPARHLVRAELQPGTFFQADVIAVLAR